jgi:serine/threonine protein phosphatase PrpC
LKPLRATNSQAVAAVLSSAAATAHMDLKVGQICDRGLNPKRPVNQDRFLAIPEMGLFAVFDGVGGQRAGEVASQTAAETIEEALIHRAVNNTSSVELIRRAIEFANRDIFELAESDPAYKTMATTIALIHIDGAKATVAHVGDSRVYRLEEGHFYRETVDHTDLNDDIRAGRIVREQASELASRNVINRALGVEGRVEVEVKSIAVRDGARFLLCSDGIYRHMSDEEIARVLAEHKDPQRAADELQRIVHQRGADDNLTAVVVQVGRARRTSIVGIDDGLESEKKSGSSVAAGASRISSGIRVDFGRSPINELPRERDLKPDYRFESEKKKPASRTVMYVLLILVLVAGAFYGGLRASDFVNRRLSGSDRRVDPLQAGREAFEKGDYKTASTQFESEMKRDPSNASAAYWFGRSMLEQRDYSAAAKSFEDAIARQPSLYEAYIQQAAAYEAMGDRTKAVLALSKYSEERRKSER